MPPLPQLLRETVHAWMEDDAGLLGAGLAYYGLMSSAPLLLIVTWVAGQAVGEETAMAEISDQIRNLFGEETAMAVLGMADAVRAAEGGFATSMLGVAVMIVASTRLFAQLQMALHQCWGIATATGGLGHRLLQNVARRALSFVLIIAMGLVLIASASVHTVLVAKNHPLINSPNLVEGVTNSGLALCLFVGFILIFRWLPCAKVRAVDIIPGAFLTSALLMLGKVLIAFYLARFAIATAYGIAGTTLVLILWMAYSAQIFLFGAEFTKVWLDHTPGGIRPLRGWQRVRRVNIAQLPTLDPPTP